MITVIEMPSFTRTALKLLGVDGLADLIIFLSANPTAGDVIPATGGFRKVRWALSGGGKSGGARAIYFFHDPGHPIVLAAIYGKNDKANLSHGEKNDLKALARDFKIDFRRY
jgi:hypothetical protein